MSNWLPTELILEIEDHIERLAEVEINTYPINIKLLDIDIDISEGIFINKEGGEININISESDLDYFKSQLIKANNKKTLNILQNDPSDVK